MQIDPFRAWRPADGLADRIACPPYDVVDTDEARRLVAKNPRCFLRVTRPEAAMAPGADPRSPEAYRRAREAFDAFRERGWLIPDPGGPACYLYRLSRGAHEQTGIVALCSIREYESGIIRRHERTRPDAESDRARHIRAIGAHSGPVLLAFPDSPAAAGLLEPPAAPAVFDIRADGVRHQIWRLPESDPVRARFAEVPRAYIADGHHRAAAAARAAREGGRPGGGGFLAALFPAGSLRIHGYHRFVTDLNGLRPDAFLAEIRRRFEIVPDAAPAPPRRGEAVMWLGRRGFRLSWPPPPHTPDPAGALDAAVLQDRLLAPVLGIRDPRTDSRVGFAGGPSGEQTVRRLAGSGRAAAGFLLCPVSMGDLMAVCDAGGAMPPKSTWFEPKLRSGLLVHGFDDGAGAG